MSNSLPLKKDSVLSRISHGIDAFAPHLLMAFSLMILSFVVINILNDAMGFLTAKISMWFQVGYLLLGAAVALACFVCGRAKAFALPVIAFCAVMLVPVLIYAVRGSIDFFSAPYYQYVIGACACLTFALSIVDITIQRKKAMEAYRAAVSADGA